MGVLALHQWGEDCARRGCNSGRPTASLRHSRALYQEDNAIYLFLFYCLDNGEYLIPWGIGIGLAHHIAFP